MWHIVRTQHVLSGPGVALGCGDGFALLRHGALLCFGLLDSSLGPRCAVALAGAARRLCKALCSRLGIRRLRCACTSRRQPLPRAQRRLNTRLFFFALDLHRDGGLAPHRCAHRRSSGHLAALRLLRQMMRRARQRPAPRRATARARTSRAAAISAARRSARAVSFALRRCSSTARSFCACVSSLPAAGGGATAAASPSARAKSAAHGWKTWRARTRVRRTRRRLR